MNITTSNVPRAGWPHWIVPLEPSDNGIEDLREDEESWKLICKKWSESERKWPSGVSLELQQAGCVTDNGHPVDVPGGCSSAGRTWRPRGTSRWTLRPESSRFSSRSFREWSCSARPVCSWWVFADRSPPASRRSLLRCTGASAARSTCSLICLAAVLVRTRRSRRRRNSSCSRCLWTQILSCIQMAKTLVFIALFGSFENMLKINFEFFKPKIF